MPCKGYFCRYLHAGIIVYNAHVSSQILLLCIDCFCLFVCLIDGETFMCLCVLFASGFKITLSRVLLRLTEYSCIASIPAPKFQFGGHTGQTVSTVVLQKKSRH